MLDIVRSCKKLSKAQRPLPYVASSSSALRELGSNLLVLHSHRLSRLPTSLYPSDLQRSVKLWESVIARSVQIG
jgi:hypothetical protein